MVVGGHGSAAWPQHWPGRWPLPARALRARGDPWAAPDIAVPISLLLTAAPRITGAPGLFTGYGCLPFAAWLWLLIEGYNRPKAVRPAGR